MTPAYTLVMARYNRWMNEKLYAVSATMTDEARKLERGAFFGSLHRTLNHLYSARRGGLGTWQAFGRVAPSRPGYHALEREAPGEPLVESRVPRPG